MSTTTLDTAAVRRWKRYPDYRPSFVDWIGNVPSHWEYARTRYVARLESGHTPSRQEPAYWVNCHLPWFTLSDVWQLRAGAKYVHETEEEISDLGLANSAARLLPKGTVILSRTASVGFSGILGRDMATSQDFVNWVCGPRLTPEFLLYVFRGMRQEFARLMMGSTHQTIYMPQVQSFSTPLPPLDEQRTIATFLDRETARIDELIGHKERLIELLEEKRRAVISHAVTRGLDPTVPLVECEAEWLAEMPAHWTVRKVKHIARRERGAFIDGDWIESPYITDDGIRLIQCGNVGTGVYEEQGYRYISEDTFRELNCTDISPGDVLICRMRSSPRILAGRACVAPDLGVRMVTAVDNCILKPAPEFDSRFLVYQMSISAYLKYIEAIARGGTRDRISRSMLADIKLVIPPLAEQQSISDHLDQVCSGYIRAADRIQDGIARLQEYRTALISATVTGQIDVRDEVIP